MSKSVLHFQSYLKPIFNNVILVDCISIATCRKVAMKSVVVHALIVRVCRPPLRKVNTYYYVEFVVILILIHFTYDYSLCTMYKCI